MIGSAGFAIAAVLACSTWQGGAAFGERVEADEVRAEGARTSGSRALRPSCTTPTVLPDRPQGHRQAAHMLEPTDELKELAQVLADWAEGVSATVYLHGSRVRGDHRQKSDVDIHIAWERDIDNSSMQWWGKENDNEFANINGKLPGGLHILDPRDPLQLHHAVEAAPVVYQCRNVRCVLLKPK